MEAITLICDVCEEPATETVRLMPVSSGKKFDKDLCDTHLSDYLAGARAPKRGRRKANG